MKPVVILQFSPSVGAGYFAEFLASRGIPHRTVRLDCGEAAPTDTKACSGIGLLGGPMSANDLLPWSHPVAELVRHAEADAVPLIGHCLGGQLMAQALGGTVTRNQQPEIGWSEASVTAGPDTQAWLGTAERFRVFQWHYDTFSLPPGATRLFSSQWCDNQAFVLGPHLGLQCHTEITRPMMELWCDNWREQTASAGNPPGAVQTVAQMREEWEHSLAAMRKISDQLYGRWIAGLQR